MAIEPASQGAEARSPGREWARVLPHLARLTWRLVWDRRVALPLRLGLAAVVVYLASPVDIVPDWVPFAGHLDDALVSTLGLRTLLRRVPQEILEEHWPGDPSLLRRLLGRRPAPGAPEPPAPRPG